MTASMFRKYDNGILEKADTEVNDENLRIPSSSSVLQTMSKEIFSVDTSLRIDMV